MKQADCACMHVCDRLLQLHVTLEGVRVNIGCPHDQPEQLRKICSVPEGNNKTYLHHILKEKNGIFVFFKAELLPECNSLNYF